MSDDGRALRRLLMLFEKYISDWDKKKDVDEYLALHDEYDEIRYQSTNTIVKMNKFRLGS